MSWSHIDGRTLVLLLALIATLLLVGAAVSTVRDLRDADTPTDAQRALQRDADARNQLMRKVKGDQPW